MNLFEIRMNLLILICLIIRNLILQFKLSILVIFLHFFLMNQEGFYLILLGDYFEYFQFFSFL